MDSLCTVEPPAEDTGLLYCVAVDDDPVVCSLIEEILGLKTFAFSTGSGLLKNKDDLSPAGVFVDIHLASNECGLDVIPEIRHYWPSIPIIVMTGDENDNLIWQALVAGANDFVLKPLRPGEVVARLNARRQELANLKPTSVLEFGDLSFDMRYRVLAGRNGQVFPPPKESEIVAFMLKQHGTVVPKDVLKRRVWGSITVSDGALDRKIHEVRKLIKQVSSTVELKTRYGQGIVLRLANHEDGQVLLGDKELLFDRERG